MTAAERMKRNEEKIYKTLEEIATQFEIDKQTLDAAAETFIKAYRENVNGK